MIKHVKADSLKSVFTDSTLSVFTDHARDNGVTQNSIIFITCDNTDADAFGQEFKEGSEWIWAKGKMYANASYPIRDEEIDSIFEDIFESDGEGSIFPGSTIDLSNYYTISDVDTLLESKADTSVVEGYVSKVETLEAGIEGKADASSLEATQSEVAGLQSSLSSKAAQSDLSSHTTNTTIHVTSSDKSKWDQVTSKANQSDLEATMASVEACEGAIQTINDTIKYSSAEVNATECYAWYTESFNDREDFKMTASFTKMGSICVLHIKNLRVIGTWGHVYYSLPYAPAEGFVVDVSIYSQDNQLIRCQSGTQSGIAVLDCTAFNGGTFSANHVLRPFTIVYKIIE